MAEAQSGDTVKVHYKGTLENGEVFDESRDREPLEFTIGEEQVIPGFEDAVEGMSPGETCEKTIKSENAYGEKRDDLVADVEREELPDDMDPDVGQHLQMQQQGGQTLNVVVVDQDDSSITVDANHPLAGHDLTFEIELMEIV